MMDISLSIHLVMQHSALFDKQSKYYKDSEYKENIWGSIAVELDCDGKLKHTSYFRGMHRKPLISKCIS